MITLKKIVSLWEETQNGHYLKCRKAQIRFSEEMHKLKKQLNKNKTSQQCTGDNII